MYQDVLSISLTIAAIAIALGIVVYGVSRTKKMMRDLEDLSHSLENAQAHLGDVHSGKDFYIEFDQKSNLLAMVNILGPSWRAYSRQVVRSDERGVIGSPKPASDYFNYDLLYAPDIQLRRHEAIPNQLVGLGLFFTFVGLALSLFIASSGLDGDIETAKESLIALMSASAMKFVTSIAAIFSALAFTHFKNQKLAELHPAIDQFAQRVDSLVVPISQEQVAEETRRELVVQTKFLEDRNEDLARAIASELDERLKTSLHDALRPVAQEIAKMAETMGEISENTMRHMVETFSKELGSAAREHSRRMAELLEAVSKAVEQVPEKIEASSEKFSEAMAVSAKNVESTFGGATSSLQKVLEDTAKLMQTSSKSWAGVSASLSKLTDELGGTQDAFGERLEAIQLTTDETISQLKSMADIMRDGTTHLPKMDEVAAKLETAANALDRSVSEIATLESVGDDTRERAAEAARQFAASVTTIEQEMKTLDQSLGSVFSKIEAGLRVFGEQADQITSTFDKNLAQAVDRLDQTIRRYEGRGSMSEAAE
ncbi:hypothetical protein [Erythrobacter aurantius]|uniref:hypothetical protein n=1 Tax=Erythrobacter aurantius TaxID=2909249 RepID=UPI00207A47ED|nr:hypothetical protein [Erythrobacter aurantius]